MCGRFSLTFSLDLLIQYFDLDTYPSTLADRYNIAPTEDVPVVRLVDGTRQLAPLHWGLIPFWADDPSIGNRMINARAETVATKRSFKPAFHHRRCLVPALGFFEWKKQGKGPKQPYFIHRKDRQPLAMAGLWEHWEGKDEQGQDQIIGSFTIITTDANDAIKDIHHRMPAIIEDPRDFGFWLDHETQDDKRLQALLKPCDPHILTRYPVSRYVNNARNKGKECIESEAEEN
jgi:putative SOS response-associated peptidase YedK